VLLNKIEVQNQRVQLHGILSRETNSTAYPAPGDEAREPAHTLLKQTLLKQTLLKADIDANNASIDGLKADIDANNASIEMSTEGVHRNNATIHQHILEHSAHEAFTARELGQHRQAIDANAAAIESAPWQEEIKSAEMRSSANLLKLESQLNKNLTKVLTAILVQRAAGECKNPLPGSDTIGAFIDPRSMNPGRTAIDRRCQGGKTYKNPFGADITYDVPDAIDMVTHHAETDATASVRAFSTLDQWKRARISSSGFSIGIGGFLSLGSSEKTQKVSGYFTSENSRLYEVERRFGSFEAILKGDLEPYLTQEVKDALSALPRTYAENKQAYKDFFERYGPFFIDQVYNGGTIKATVVLSAGASVEAQNTASATYSGVRASVGGWAVGFGSGGGGGDSSLTATIREQSSSEIQVLGGDHTDPVAFDVMTWTSEDYERWMQSVRQSPKLIHYRVRSAAELTNEPALKEAIRAAISDVYGDRADDAEMFQQLTQTYHSLNDQVDGLAIPSQGSWSVSYFNCHFVALDYSVVNQERQTSCPAGESVVGTKQYHRWGTTFSKKHVTHMKCCQASISV